LPAAVPTTLSDSVQFVEAAMLPPDSETTPVPDVAVTVPPQVFETPLGVATARPPGSVSVKPTPVRPAAFGLAIKNVSDVVPFRGIDAAPNDFAIVGGVITVIEALEVLPVPALVEVT
jgi:hypothetical protein